MQAAQAASRSSVSGTSRLLPDPPFRPVAHIPIAALALPQDDVPSLERVRDQLERSLGEPPSQDRLQLELDARRESDARRTAEQHADVLIQAHREQSEQLTDRALRLGEKRKEKGKILLDMLTEAIDTAPDEFRATGGFSDF